MPPKKKIYIKNCTGSHGEESDKEKSEKIISKMVFYILLVLFVGVLIFMLFFSRQLEIVNIEIKGTQQLNGSEIRRNVETSLQGKYFNVIPKNNYLLISSQRMENNLKNEYKKLRSVEILKKFPDSINISIDERKGLLVWCAGGENCFLLDENGIAYSAADFNSPEIVQNNLFRVNDLSGATANVNDKIMEKDYEQYLLKLKDSLKSLNIEIENTFNTPSRMADEIRVRSNNGFDILLSTHFSMESAIRTLEVFLKKELAPEKISELEYIDLRSEYKAFYKLKKNESENESEEDATEKK